MRLDKSWLIFLAAAAVFLAIKISAANYSVSDENTYYKMGQLVAAGETPYRDFFFAHPPLQAYIYAAVFKLFGFNLLLLKMLSAMAVVAAAAFVFAAIKDGLNAKIAAAATTLFLFSYGTMLLSNFPTGTEFAAAFATAAFYFFMKKRFLASGLLLGIASATAQLSMILLPVLAASAVFALKDRKAAFRMLAGFAVVFIAVNGLFLAITGLDYIRQTVLYHMQKPAEDIDKGAVFLRVLKTNLLLFATAAAALASGKLAKAGLAIPLAAAAAYLAAFPLLKTAFNYYLLYAFPFLAIAGGYGISLAFGLLYEKAKLRKELAAAAVAAVILLSSFFAAKDFASYGLQDFPVAEDAAAFIRENSAEGQTIFGDDSTVPLISLLSGREIALNYVDNNVMRYRSGTTDLSTTLHLLQEAAGRKELKYVLLRRTVIQKGSYADFGTGTEEQFMAFVSNYCGLAKKFEYRTGSLQQQLLAYDCLKTKA